MIYACAPNPSCVIAVNIGRYTVHMGCCQYSSTGIELNGTVSLIETCLHSALKAHSCHVGNLLSLVALEVVFMTASVANQ